MHDRINTYMTAEEFKGAVAAAEPGSWVRYGLGDLANAAAAAPNIFALRLLARNYAKQGIGCLTQRRRPDLTATRGGACFEYLFKKSSAALG
jgi:hypothetical protein